MKRSIRLALPMLSPFYRNDRFRGGVLQTALPLLAVLLLAGCAVSTPFREANKQNATRWEAELRHYAQTDAQKSDVAAFVAALREPSTTGAALDAAWTPVAIWYGPAIDADPLLDPMAKKLRHEWADDLQKRISAERARAFGSH